VADYLYDAAYDHSSYSFLANIHDEGEVGVGYLSVAVSASFAGSTAGEYEVFSEPDYDCGKGRIIVVDPTGGRTEWGLDSSGVLGDAACEGYFGADLGVGDFNGDGYDDLAVGSPGAAVGSLSSAGKVHVLYGSATGLTAAGDQMFHQNSTGISGSAHAWTFFAERLTTGDFDCNGSDDLVVGSPRATVGGHYEAGIVHVLYGTTGGLSSVNDLLYEGSAGVGDTPMDHDHFGASVAAGQLNSSSCADLAIGVPGEDIATASDVGQVHVLYGSSTGLPTQADVSLMQGTAGVANTASAYDRFGARLEVSSPPTGGDILRILVPNEQCYSGSNDPVIGWHLIQAGTAGINLTTDTLECTPVGEVALPTDVWGDLKQLTRLHAVRISQEATP
jgi:hypothetical protein